MNKPVTFDENGGASWTQEAGDQYVATGVDRSGKRFVFTGSNWRHIKCINIWQGSRWLLRNGKRFLIERVCN
jgi:hypothetical protein